MELTDEDKALFDAIRENNYELVAKLVKESNINAMSEWDGAPINLAARLGNLEIVKLLCENQADIESKDATDMTPIMNACVEGHNTIVEYLKNKGAIITRELLMIISQKVNILKENADLGYVNPSAATAWEKFLEWLVKEYNKQQN